jgi:hypothetical protein
LLTIYAKSKIIGDKYMVKAGIKSTVSQDFSAFVLITSVTGVVSALAMYLVLSSNLIVGWDTPVYLYRTSVLIEKGLVSFLQASSNGSNGLLYYFLLYILYTTTGQSLFLLEKIVPSILFGGLLITPSLVMFVWTRRTHVSLVCLLFTLAWPAPYLLAADLDSNLLGFILVLLAMSFVPRGLLSSPRDYLVSIVLMIAASLAHPSAVYFGLVIVAGVSLAMILRIRRRIILVKAILLLVASSTLIILRALLTGELGGYPQIVNPSQPQEGGASVVDITWGLVLIGYTLLPMVVVSLWIVLGRIVESHKAQNDKEELVSYSVVFVWAMSTLLIWLSSYILPIQSTYPERLLFLFPLPFLMTFLLAAIRRDLT